MLSLRKRVNNCGPILGFADILHIIETVEEWIDKLCSHNHKLRKLLLQRCVKLIVFLRRELKILLQLSGQSV